MHLQEKLDNQRSQNVLYSTSFAIASSPEAESQQFDVERAVTHIA